MILFTVCSNKPEIWWWLEHVHCGDLEGDGLKLGQEVQVHEVLLAEQTSTFPSPIDGGGLEEGGWT